MLCTARFARRNDEATRTCGDNSATTSRGLAPAGAPCINGRAPATAQYANKRTIPFMKTGLVAISSFCLIVSTAACGTADGERPLAKIDNSGAAGAQDSGP